jgi:Tfp pilus assembly protein PilN
MTTSATETTTTTLVALPRVNLLPPEIGAARRLRKLQVGLGAGVGASVLVVGALVLAAAGQVSDAQDGLDTAKARGTALQAETNKYADVPAVYAAVDAKEAQLNLAMGKEIRWSYFLNDLSLVTPGKVWLETLTVVENVEPAPVTAAAPAPGAAPVNPAGIGTVTVTGRGFQHNDVAAWLRALAGQKGLSNPYFTLSEQENYGPGEPVRFESQAVLTDEALSHRYTDKAGS